MVREGTVAGAAEPRKPVTLREAAGIVFVLMTLLLAWGASAVVLHLLLGTRWTLSLAAAPVLLLVATVVRNALRSRRRVRTGRSG
ncbi:MAG: hypothetical protein HY906_08445 [Deltaproteobacteria bacterium]|nr:hypothetical protein [Deltaproteobacteria bacterium]